jgi:hypothetical protein
VRLSTGGAALATLVGVLAELPVMLSVVAIVNRPEALTLRGHADYLAARDGRHPEQEQSQ